VIERGPRLWLAFAAVVTCVAWTWLPLTMSVPNERTRVYLTMALVERGEVRVDSEVQRFGRLIDLAKSEGHYYTDKAPGSSLLGVPVYALARALTPGREWTSTEVLVLLRRGLMLPIALLGLCALFQLLTQLGVSSSSAAFASVAWPLATTAQHYAGAFMGHHIVAVALVVSVLLAVQGRDAQGARNIACSFGAGVLAGLAGLVEYQAGPACAVLGVWVLVSQRRRPLGVLAFALGVAPGLASLLAYNAAAFGSPFALSYTHVATQGFASNHNHGIGGVDVPKLKAVLGLLISPHRGLFVTAPLSLLAIPGTVWLAQKQRSLAITVALMVVIHVLVIAGFDGWWGGWSYGPRLLLPVLGVAFVPIAFALDALRTWRWSVALVAALALAGAVQTGVMRAGFFESPDEVRNPIFDLAFPAIERGLCAPSIGQALGLTRCAGVVPGALLALTVLTLAFLAWSRAARARAAAMVLALLMTFSVLALTERAPRSSREELDRAMRIVARHQPSD
jgi:hypothetical protein